jgi:hypothetical protein
MSTDFPIEVTFYVACPPMLSHLSVYCPDLQLLAADLSLAPKAIAADEDLILLQVPIHPKGKSFHHFNDYFVYRVHHEHPKLDLLPKSCGACFRDGKLAVLGCGADDEMQYVVLS